MPASPPTPARFGLARVLAAILFAVGGLVLVWQGFGLAGYGTDWHPKRALPTFLALLAAGFLVARRGPWRVVKGAAAVAGGGLAAYAWWEVPAHDFKSAVSLREAVQRRDQYREQLTVTTPEAADQSNGHRGVWLLVEEYPSLCADLPGRLEAWATSTAAEIASRYEQLAPDSYIGAGALAGTAKVLRESHPATADALERARAKWSAAALRERTDELTKVPAADWDGFNGTAFGRKLLLENLPEHRAELAAVEAAWVQASVRAVVASPGGPGRTAYEDAYRAVLTLRSTDEGDDRFRGPRERLFRAALDDARARAGAHFAAGAHDLAAGVAAAHEIAWATHAKALGPDRYAAVTAFRDAHAALAALVPPRPDPDDVPPPRPRP